ncbi:MAG: hypothetical protein ACI9MB_003616, partial [Verrucomicrobiales bacterium]
MRLLYFATCSLLLCTQVLADTFKDDATRAEQVRKNANEQLRNGRLDFRWNKDESQVWFHHLAADNKPEILVVDTATGEKTSQPKAKAKELESASA